ncbi:NCS2 family permease [Natrarchaeobius halalkaliphilus]|uniref:NCS2 family permease n=1 Tax=Natrarchaeobius halalkaliphilus TaxID=1679091 RepID=A0A3N6LSG9_9EURY|nr:NCS2 family permease [Natrarchaeobius halalkaliphilus]RQG92883.1 NCS2 family permease [Natrarchaeobius halalkaliphilus]
MGATDTIAEFFGFDEHETDYRTETLAGVTTFLAMAYIIVVNPAILSEAIVIEGYDQGEVFQMLAIVTILASIVGTAVMAFHANRPFGLAPGMGLNAFFAFTVVIVLGVPWELALAAVFVEGIIFIALTAVGARKYIIELFPEPVKFSVGAGIGIFLLFLGLQEMELVVPYVDADGFPSGTLIEMGNALQSPIATLSVIGLAFTFFLYARGINGSIVIGILTTAAAGWLLTLAGLVQPGVLTPDGAYDDVTNEGIVSLLMSVQYDITPLFWGFVEGLGMIADEPLVFALVVFTFFFVDFFDTAGTLIGVSQFGGFLDEDGDLPDIDRPLMADAVGTTVGSMIGTSTVTTYIESSTGIEEGGRTGFTALVVAAFFFLALFTVPLVQTIPHYATYLALVVVGIIMLQGVADIDWDDPVWLISSGLTITIMPLTASIANGIAAGIISYPLIKTAIGDGRDVSLGQWTLAITFVVYFIVYFAAEAGIIAF